MGDILHIYYTADDSKKGKILRDVEEGYDRRKKIQEEIDRDDKKKQKQSS